MLPVTNELRNSNEVRDLPLYTCYFSRNMTIIKVNVKGKGKVVPVLNKAPRYEDV